MKKIFAGLVLIISIILYAVSSSDFLTKKTAAYKEQSNSIFGSDKYSYGDLYGFSRIAHFRKKHRTLPPVINLTTCEKEKSVDLYMLCDSYVWSFANTASYYCGVHKLQYATINKKDQLQVKLDTAKKNILMLEFGERNFRPLLHYDDEYLQTFIHTDTSTFVAIKSNSKKTLKDITHDLVNGFINKNINTNIEYIFWETALFTPIKELKSSINDGLFGRIDKDVLMAPDNKYLLYEPTIDSSAITSSFKAISDAEIDTMVNKLNTIYTKYRKQGFDEVYFSIIPNPVTILYPHYHGLVYNDLIPRIQKHAGLQIKSVSVYDDFKTTPYQVYMDADTHWNRNGFNIWLNTFNILLSKY